jgi:uncharacterized protein YybS (DUF2232 family)
VSFFLKDGDSLGDREPSFLKDLSLAIALLMPCLAGPLSNLLQLFLPGIGACIMAAMERRRALFLSGAVFVAAGGVMVAMGFAGAMLILAQNVLIAAGIFLCLERARSGAQAWIQVSIALVGLSIVYLFVGSGGELASAYRQIIEVVERDLDLGFKAFSQNYAGSQGKELPPDLEVAYGQVKGLFLYYFPGLMASMMAFTVLGNLWSCRTCRLKAMTAAPRKGYRVEGLLSPFSAWRLPFWFVWIFIAAGITALLPVAWAEAAGKNGVLFISIFYLVQGFWIVRYFFQRLETPWWIRGIVYILIGIQWYGLLLVTLTGLLDTWIDFRGRLERARQDRE